MKMLLSALAWLAVILLLFAVSPWLGLPAALLAALVLWNRINDARDAVFTASIAAGAKELRKRRQEAEAERGAG